jgi:hypothetical protein
LQPTALAFDNRSSKKTFELVVVVSTIWEKTVEEALLLWLTMTTQETRGTILGVIVMIITKKLMVINNNGDEEEGNEEREGNDEDHDDE